MTDRVTIPKKAHRDQPGPWWAPITTEGILSPYPMLSCPNGHAAGISDHTVADDGKVSPSLVCPEKGCGWHVWGTLEGWPD